MIWQLFLYLLIRISQEIWCSLSMVCHYSHNWRPFAAMKADTHCKEVTGLSFQRSRGLLSLRTSFGPISVEVIATLASESFSYTSSLRYCLGCASSSSISFRWPNKTQATIVQSPSPSLLSLLESTWLLEVILLLFSCHFLSYAIWKGLYFDKQTGQSCDQVHYRADDQLHPYSCHHCLLHQERFRSVQNRRIGG